MARFVEREPADPDRALAPALHELFRIMAEQLSFLRDGRNRLGICRRRTVALFFPKLSGSGKKPFRRRGRTARADDPHFHFDRDRTFSRSDRRCANPGNCRDAPLDNNRRHLSGRTADFPEIGQRNSPAGNGVGNFPQRIVSHFHLGKCRLSVDPFSAARNAFSAPFVLLFLSCRQLVGSVRACLCE